MGESLRGDDDAIREGETSSRREEEKKKRHPSLISLARARAASKPDGVSSLDSRELIQGLYEGVLLDDDKVKFWIDQKLHQNCLIVLAKVLSITWGDDTSYWIKDPNSYQEDCFRGAFNVEVAVLKRVCWLDISGSLTSVMLSPMAKYEVVFELMMTQGAQGWYIPVNLSLSLPDGTTQSRTENLGMKPKGQWLQIPLGEFEATQKNIGNIRFSLSEHGTHWKSGLKVKGVIFRPKY